MLFKYMEHLKTHYLMLNKSLKMYYNTSNWKIAGSINKIKIIQTLFKLRQQVFHLMVKLILKDYLINILTLQFI